MFVIRYQGLFVVCRCRSTFSTAPDMTITSANRGRVPVFGKKVNLTEHGLIPTSVAVAAAVGEAALREFCSRAQQRLQRATTAGLVGWQLVGDAAPHSWRAYVHAFEVARTIVSDYSDLMDVKAVVSDLNHAAVGFFFACAEATSFPAVDGDDDPVLVIGAAALRTLLFTQQIAAEPRSETDNGEDDGGKFVLTGKHIKAIHAVLWVSPKDPGTSRDLLCGWLEALAQGGALTKQIGASDNVVADTESLGMPATIQFVFCELLVKVCRHCMCMCLILLQCASCGSLQEHFTVLSFGL